MTRRQSFFSYVALLVGVLTFATSFTRSTSGQPGATSPAAVGRYQISSAGEATNAYAFVIDTVTGRTWTHPLNGKWVDLGIPK